MLIQKVFHIHRSPEETRALLANINSYRDHLVGVSRAMITADGIGHFEAQTSAGYTLSADVAEVPSSESANTNRVLFRSVTGNIDFVGMIEFFEIKENLTEVVLDLDYYLTSPLHRMMDWAAATVDHLINRQIERIQMHFDGMHTGVASPSSATERSREIQLPRPSLAHTPRFA